MGFVLGNIQACESKFDLCIFVFFHRSYSCQHFFPANAAHSHSHPPMKQIHYSYLANEITLTIFDCAAQLQLLLKDRAML